MPNAQKRPAWRRQNTRHVFPISCVRLAGSRESLLLPGYSQHQCRRRGGLSDRIGRSVDRQATITRAMAPQTGGKTRSGSISGEGPPVTSANPPGEFLGMATLRGSVSSIVVLCRDRPVSPGRESVKWDLVTCHLLVTEGRSMRLDFALMHWVNQFVGVGLGST